MANLDDNQKQQIRKWLDEGLKLAEIQSRMASELDIKMTYMELRFLLDDLSLKPKDPEPPKEPPPAKPSQENKPEGPETAEAELLDEPNPGRNVSVGVDQIARPGTIVSGKVTFSDGNKAEWYLDQTGRLGVVPAKEGYKPSQADLLTFQNALQGELAKMGF